jgi:hypothetical protein
MITSGKPALGSTATKSRLAALRCNDNCKIEMKKSSDGAGAFRRLAQRLGKWDQAE